MRELKLVAKDTNIFLKKILKKQKNTKLLEVIKYGLFPGGKKIRSKILVDVGYIFNINYKSLIRVAAAIECIHAYSLIHDDLPCMDNDKLRRGKPTAHIIYGESTAVLAGNSLLTLAFEILSDDKFNISNNVKNELINLISKCSGHEGVAGGQYLDLNYEKKNVSKKKIIDMQIKKTGMLFSFCCVAPVILAKKNNLVKRKFRSLGNVIGLLFQISDDLIDLKGKTRDAGKETGKDKKKGKATLIGLLGYENAIKYKIQLVKKISEQIKHYDNRSKKFKQTINLIANRIK
ncbi:polyprenyl synthetase family protein [Candidatus Pelagibacter sp.]|jgi:farnesyl diphosphate synthase|nr:polyprenyl synthetase family protein [Candidatus Pelagibacter sp.]